METKIKVLLLSLAKCQSHKASQQNGLPFPLAIYVSLGSETKLGCTRL